MSENTVTSHDSESISFFTALGCPPGVLERPPRVRSNRTSCAPLSVKFGVPWLGFQVAVNELFTENTTDFAHIVGTNLPFILSRPETHSGDAADACPVSVGVPVETLPPQISN